METKIAVGRRKAAIARVILKKGKGKITVNGKDFKEYFPVDHLIDDILRPVQAVERDKDFDFQVNVRGGGIKGQAQAVRLGIARVLVKEDEEMKPALKAQQLVTRDARIVERKKPGLRKARKKEQYSKR